MTNAPTIGDLLDLAVRFQKAATTETLSNPGMIPQVQRAFRERKNLSEPLTKEIWASIADINATCSSEEEAAPRLASEVDPKMLALCDLAAGAFESVAGLDAENLVPAESRTAETSAAFAARGCPALARLFAPRKS